MLTLGEFPGAVVPAGDVPVDDPADDRRRRSCGVSMAPAARTSAGRCMAICLGAAAWEKDPGLHVFPSGTRRTTRSSPRAGTGPDRSIRVGRVGRPGAWEVAGLAAPVAETLEAGPVEVADGAVDEPAVATATAEAVDAAWPDVDWPVVDTLGMDTLGVDGLGMDGRGAAPGPPGWPASGVVERNEGCHHRGVPTVPARTAGTCWGPPTRCMGPATRRRSWPDWALARTNIVESAARRPTKPARNRAWNEEGNVIDGGVAGAAVTSSCPSSAAVPGPSADGPPEATS